MKFAKLIKMAALTALIVAALVGPSAQVHASSASLPDPEYKYIPIRR